MNPKHKPLGEESILVAAIQAAFSNHLAMRITENMFTKHHIDAIKEFREFLSYYKIFDFLFLSNGDKKVINLTIVEDNFSLASLISFNRSSNRKTKLGDSRYWISGLKRFADVNDLIVFFVYEGELFLTRISNTSTLQTLTKTIETVKSSSYVGIKKQLIDKFYEIRDKGFIKSISPNKRNDKDAGETFETNIGISQNSSKKADFMDRIEIKSKSEKTQSKDSCFNRIPDEEISPIKNTKAFVLKYGYPDNNPDKYPNYCSLFIEVGGKPNNRGFFIEVDNVNEYVVMNHIKDGIICRWHFKTLKERLETKHPATLWLIFEEKLDEDGDIAFRYYSAELTKKVDFASFIQLISEGKVVYNWRARVRYNGTGYDDHGNGFRLNKKHRKIIFGEPEQL